MKLLILLPLALLGCSKEPEPQPRKQDTFYYISGEPIPENVKWLPREFKMIKGIVDVPIKPQWDAVKDPSPNGTDHVPMPVRPELANLSRDDPRNVCNKHGSDSAYMTCLQGLRERHPKLYLRWMEEFQPGGPTEEYKRAIYDVLRRQSGEAVVTKGDER